MIGPIDEKVIKKVCRGCDQVIFKKLDATKRFPKKTNGILLHPFKFKF